MNLIIIIGAIHDIQTRKEGYEYATLDKWVCQFLKKWGVGCLNIGYGVRQILKNKRFRSGVDMTHT